MIVFKTAGFVVLFSVVLFLAYSAGYQKARWEQLADTSSEGCYEQAEKPAAVVDDEVVTVRKIYRKNTQVRRFEGELSSGMKSKFSALHSMLYVLSEQELADMALALNILDQEQLYDIASPKKALKNLLDVVSLGVESNLYDVPKLDWIKLSSLPIKDGEVSETSAFSAEQETIYAYFSTSGYSQGSVLVRWLRTDEPEVLLLKTISINGANPINYVYLTQHNGWRSGDYRVEIYSVDDDVGFLAAKDYAVFSAQ